MKTKLNRTVPNWVDVILILIFAGTFANAVKKLKQVEESVGGMVGYLIGTLIGLAIFAVIVRWLLSWCFGLIRIALTRNTDEYDL